VGLREEKRLRQRAAIIANAISLFRARSFEATTVREVARHCQISEATFFNYFPTKDAVLGHWACDQLTRAFAESAADGGSLRPVVRAMARRLAAEVEADREFAAHAFARVRLGQLPLPAAAVPVVERAQAVGELRRDVPPTDLARLLVGTAAATMTGWLAEQIPVFRGDGRAGDARGARSSLAGRPPVPPPGSPREPSSAGSPSQEPASLEARLRLSLDLILDGARRRHERVRPGDAAAIRAAPADR